MPSLHTAIERVLVTLGTSFGHIRNILAKEGLPFVNYSGDYSPSYIRSPLLLQNIKRLDFKNIN